MQKNGIFTGIKQASLRGPEALLLMDRSVDRIRRELYGESISPGVAIEKALLFKQITLDALEMNSFPVDDPAMEIKRLEIAINKSREQLKQISDQLEKEKHGTDISLIFNVQLQLLEDKAFLQELKKLARAQRMNIEHVIASQMRVLETRFSSIHDEIIRTKFLDIQDAYHRILRNLLDIEHVRTNPMQRIEEPVIFVSERLVPSDVALLDFKKIRGIIIEEGSRVSHVAVISKSLGIPAIINVPGASSLVRSGEPLIVDGYTGRAIVHPAESEVSAYREKREHFLSSKIIKQKTGYCETKDGRRIKLEANIGTVKEAEEAMAYGAEGIGLLRSELFYISCAHLPSVQEEIDFYRKIIAITKRRPITIRLLDLGADKTLPFVSTFTEENPQLGNRGIRYLFHHPDLLNNHLMSVLSVCRLATVKVALPFVATLEDLKKAIYHIQSGCRKLRLNFEALSIGIMAEIPSVALSVKSFLSRVSFINIGTNDLVQYIFAASREDGYLEEYRQCTHPAIIRLIRKIIITSTCSGKEVSICGEMASDPRMAALLVGAGASAFSMQPSSIPAVRQIISEHNFSDLQKIAGKAVALDSEKEVNQLISDSLY